jgi:glycosyltransferase involved in cell wall biosynthesis
VRRRILYIQYTNPAVYPPLEHSSRILADAGWDVMFLGAGSDGESDRFQFPAHSRICVRRMAVCKAGIRQKLHFGLFCLWVLSCVIRWRPKCVYASDLFSSPVSLALSAWPGLRVIYHEHDSPEESLSGTSVFMRFVLWCRLQLAGRSDANVLPNGRRAEQFRKATRTGRPVLTAWNCPEKREVIAGPRAAHDGKVVLFYHGSINPARLPLAVVRAMATMPDRFLLRVAGYGTEGHRGHVQTLREEAERLKIGASIECIGALPTRAELLAECGRADVGLSLMPKAGSDPNLNAMTGASNKPFDYLACGLALLVSDLPDWREMFVNPGHGLACDPEDPASIARALRQLAENPEHMRAMGERGRQRIIAEWNYETQFSPVLSSLENGATAR